MGIFSKLKTVFRGDVPLRYLASEALRRRKAAARRRAERGTLDALNERPARLLPEFEKYSPSELLDHFRSDARPRCWPRVFSIPEGEKQDVLRAADRIADTASWELMGFGLKEFSGENVWRCDPLSGRDWGLEYHADMSLARNDGSDVRVLWELNRFGQALPLAFAFRATGQEKYAENFFSQVSEWIEQNPYGRGANWGCAMEVALRAVHLLAAFDVFRTSSVLTEARLAMMLRLFDQHGQFILDNNEFSYISTSNHYLSDVVGLFWIGTLVSELEKAAEWQDLGLKEMLREMEKQVLPDGADFESSSGYHRFVTEMYLHTFRLAETNGIEIAETYRQKLDAMLNYLRSITRPNGKMPLVGDCDGSQFLPLRKQDADDSWYLLELAGLQAEADARSAAFRSSGLYVQRARDLYLLFNASDCGLNGRGSHGHNDALSIEVSALGRPFIVDPGSYAYNLDLDARHLFRSTATHSTVIVDGAEQNTIERDMPFVGGNEAAPKLLEWTAGDEIERVSAEHYGYRRRKGGLTHRRTVELNKRDRFWRIDDEIIGSGTHEAAVCFHLAPGISAEVRGGVVDLSDNEGRHLLVRAVGLPQDPLTVDSFFAPNYGQKVPTATVMWKAAFEAPTHWTVFLVPAQSASIKDRLELTLRLADNK